MNGGDHSLSGEFLDISKFLFFIIVFHFKAIKLTRKNVKKSKDVNLKKRKLITFVKVTIKQDSVII